jgi:hypothetical protein
MRRRPELDTAVLEAVQMLLFWLRHNEKQTMLPLGGGPVLDVARRILKIDLQKENQEGVRYWRVRDGVETRLTLAGLSETGLLLNLERWRLAVDFALAEIRDRKEKKRLRKQQEVAVILDIRQGQILDQVDELSYSDQVETNGAARRHEAFEDVSNLRSFSFGAPAKQSAPEIFARKKIASGPPHKPRRPAW